MSDLASLTVIRTDHGNVPVVYLPAVDSTHEEAKRRLDQKTVPPFVVVADEQLAGRGRRGREWLSEPQVGIWMTLAVPKARPAPEWFAYTFAASLAVGDAIRERTGLSARLKWPNDVLLNGKKCCGILLEIHPSAVLIGIGINVNHPHFPEGIANHATSMLLETGRTWPRAELLSRCVYLITSLNDWPAEKILDRWKSQSSFLGSEIVADTGDGILKGTAVDIAADGGLVIDTGESIRIVYAGDVRVRRAGE